MGRDKLTRKEKKKKIKEDHPEYSDKEVRQAIRNWEMKTGGPVVTRSFNKHP